jgi:hypothetical protein
MDARSHGRGGASRDRRRGGGGAGGTRRAPRRGDGPVVEPAPDAVAAARDGTPILIVRREAFDRYAQLREMGDAWGIPVIWDRRLGDRRQAVQGPPVPERFERRRADRRRAPPITWRALDFVLTRARPPRAGAAPTS